MFQYSGPFALETELSFTCEVSEVKPAAVVTWSVDGQSLDATGMNTFKTVKLKIITFSFFNLNDCFKRYYCFFVLCLATTQVSYPPYKGRVFLTSVEVLNLQGSILIPILTLRGKSKLY